MNQPTQSNREQIDYALYDGRYLTDPDRTICYTFCDTLKEARRERRDYGDDTVIVKCTKRVSGDGLQVIINEEIVQ